MGLRYFGTVGGESVRFDRVDNRNGSSLNTDSWGWHAATGQWVKIERVVRFKSNPSRHECDARCMHATGRTMNCECSCGGKNHGRGSVPAIETRVAF